MAMTQPRSGIAPRVAKARSGLDARDAAATSLGIVAAVVVWATLSDQGWFLLEGTRSATAVLGVIGMAMCSVGAKITPGTKTGPFLVTAYVLGTVAMGLLIAGLVVGSEALFVTLAIDMAVLWVVATTRHALGRS
jgi:hypothetical protein